MAANHDSPGGHGNDTASREAKEIRANKVLMKCFGISSVKDRQDAGGMGALFMFFVVAVDARSLSQIYGWCFDASRRRRATGPPLTGCGEGPDRLARLR